MTEVIFPGPVGRIEGRFHMGTKKESPIALVLHPHPQFGGTMNNQIVYQTYYAFAHRGCHTLRINFRGVGKSEGQFDHGVGEVADAAAALDWTQQRFPTATSVWVAGFSFGAWISMQLLMRRPEVRGWISIAPPCSLYDFTFLLPVPAPGLIVNGERDAVVPSKDVSLLIDRLKIQKRVKIDQVVIPEANHFFEDKHSDLMSAICSYLDGNLK
jgi:alpha/beta superfamily hydrolase